jgi:hypothetical protein
MGRHLDEVVSEPVRPYIDAIAQVRNQDLEPSPDGGLRIRHRVARDRRISVDDAEMRHGRKSDAAEPMRRTMLSTCSVL